MITHFHQQQPGDLASNKDYNESGVLFNVIESDRRKLLLVYSASSEKRQIQKP